MVVSSVEEELHVNSNSNPNSEFGGKSGHAAEYNAIMNKYYTSPKNAQNLEYIPDELGPIRQSEQLLKEALVLNPAYVDKNVHETMKRLYAYRIHQQKLKKMKRQTEIKK